jgi:hypothetical protein
MPNPQNTVQVAAQRARRSYLDTYELNLDATTPALGSLFMKTLVAE